MIRFFEFLDFGHSLPRVYVHGLVAMQMMRILDAQKEAHLRMQN